MIHALYEQMRANGGTISLDDFAELLRDDGVLAREPDDARIEREREDERDETECPTDEGGGETDTTRHRKPSL